MVGVELGCAVAEAVSLEPKPAPGRFDSTPVSSPLPWARSGNAAVIAMSAAAANRLGRIGFPQRAAAMQRTAAATSVDPPSRFQDVNGGGTRFILFSRVLRRRDASGMLVGFKG